MKRFFFLSIVLLCSAAIYAQPQMSRVDSLKSSVLGGAYKKYSISLPQGYDRNVSKKYPVLYLLHGGGGSHTDWLRQGTSANVISQLTASGEMKEMIIVYPDAGETLMTYFNDPEWRYEDFFFQEFIPFIEGKYRVIADKQHRAIAGLSMGGQGTFVYAFRHPEYFSSAYAISAFMYSYGMDKSREPKLHALVDANNAVKLLQDATDSQKDAFKSVKIFIDCGDDDFTFNTNMEVVSELRKANIPYQLRVRDGGHTWEYWHSALYTILPFVSRNFTD